MICRTNRRSWDPELVPKEIQALDQSITMFNLVKVCAFCAQYFDPEFPGGIAAPEREPKRVSIIFYQTHCVVTTLITLHTISLGCSHWRALCDPATDERTGQVFRRPIYRWYSYKYIREYHEKNWDCTGSSLYASRVITIYIITHRACGVKSTIRSSAAA